MSTLIPVADKDGVLYERPSRVGMWIGGVDQLLLPATRFALASYSSGELVGVYRLYHCDGSLIYVGVTSDPLRRWRQHAATKDWWPQVDHLVLVPFGTTETARHIERQIVMSERPMYNIQYGRRSS